MSLLKNLKDKMNKFDFDRSDFPDMIDEEIRLKKEAAIFEANPDLVREAQLLAAKSLTNKIKTPIMMIHKDDLAKPEIQKQINLNKRKQIQEVENLLLRLKRIKNIISQMDIGPSELEKIKRICFSIQMKATLSKYEYYPAIYSYE